MIIGFLLSWLPYIVYLGDVLLLIGTALVFLGRVAFCPEHRTFAKAAGILLVVGLVGAFVVAVALIGVVAGEAAASGATLSQIGAKLSTDLVGFAIAALVLGFLASLGRVLLVYQLSDRSIRVLLWTAFGVGEAISIAIAWYFLPLVDGAITRATAGSTIDLGPIVQLQNQLDLLGIVLLVPFGIFAWAYHRVRGRLRAAWRPGAPLPNSDSVQPGIP